MTATPGITKSLAEKIADAHEILVIYTAPFLQDGNEKVTALRIQREFADATTMEPCGSYTTRVPEDDWDAVLSFLHDRATARLAALQDEARKALGVPEVSPPVAAPTFKVGDRVRYVGSDELYGVAVGTSGEITSLPNSPTGQTAVVKFGGPFILMCFDELELIPSPLSGDFISEADDARLVRVGKVIARSQGQDPVSGPKGREYRIGTMSEDDSLKADWEDCGSGGWINAYSAKPRLAPEARLTLRTAEATLTADERAKVEAAP